MLDSLLCAAVASLPVGLLIFTCWVILLYVYRLTLHPLAKFPGPKVAAVTRWYEFYYDVVLKGKYMFCISEMHEKYGPIVRISPDEIHIKDPEFYDTLYAKSGRLHKREGDCRRFGNPTSVFMTPNADIHRQRRAALNPYFSKRNVDSFQPGIRAKVNQLLDRMTEYRKTGDPMTISLAYSALTGDVIMQYSYGYDYNHLASTKFTDNFHYLVRDLVETGVLATHFPILMKLLVSLPQSLAVKSTPSFALMFQLFESMGKDVKKAKEQELLKDVKPDSSRPTVIHHLLRSDMPAREKVDQRLVEELANLPGAGTSTATFTLSVATFYIISNRLIYSKLRTELEKAIPDPKSPDALEWSKLEKCEYLTACIKESIRLGFALSGRAVRLSDSTIIYEQWQIPAMTAVSMTMPDISFNEDIFPESHSFKPERWLAGASTKTGEPIDKYWLGFGKGSRSCLGMHLAWLELYTVLAGVFRSFDLELFRTDESDVTVAHDFYIPSVKLNSEGVRVLVKG